MYWKTKLFVLITASLMMWGCTAALQQLITHPVATFEGMTLKNNTLFEATPVFRFNLSNPNPMGLDVLNITYNLKVNDRKFVKGVQDSHTRIKAISTGKVALPVTFHYMDVFYTAAEFVQSDKVAYELAGTIGIGPFALPYHTDGMFDVPKLPKISLAEIQLSDFSFSDAFITFIVNIENPNPFSIRMNAMAYHIKLNGEKIVQDITTNVPPVGRNDIISVRIPFNAYFFKLGHTLYTSLDSASSNYELSGRMRFNIPEIGERDFPFYMKGKAPIVKKEMYRFP